MFLGKFSVDFIATAIQALFHLERHTRIELVFSDWQTEVIDHYTNAANSSISNRSHCAFTHFSDLLSLRVSHPNRPINSTFRLNLQFRPQHCPAFYSSFDRSSRPTQNRTENLPIIGRVL